jgi:hypothetical protein
VLTTGDIDAGANSMIRLARPLIDNGSANVSVASRQRLDGEITFSTPVSASSENRVSLRSNGRFHRVSVTPTGAWAKAMGVEFEITPTGGR